MFTEFCDSFTLPETDSGTDSDSDSKPNRILIQTPHCYCTHVGDRYPYPDWDRSPCLTMYTSHYGLNTLQNSDLDSCPILN